MNSMIQVVQTKEFYRGLQGVSTLISYLFSKSFPRLPWWSSGEDSTCLCGGHGFDPCFGKTPHALRQLNPCTTTTEARRPQSPRPTTTEATARRSPCATARQCLLLAATGESLCTATKTQH